MQLPEVSDGGLVEVWVWGVGGKPSNKKEKQIKLAFIKTNATNHIQRPLYLDSNRTCPTAYEWIQTTPISATKTTTTTSTKTPNTCRAPGSSVPGHLAHHLAETSVRQLVPNLGHELTTISSLHTSIVCTIFGGLMIEIMLMMMMINMVIIRMIKILRITSGVGRSEEKLAVLSDIARSWYVWFCIICNNQVCYERPLGPHHEVVSFQLLVSWGRPVQDQAPDQDGDHDDFVECGDNLGSFWRKDLIWFWWRPAAGGETWPCCWKPCGLGRGRTWRSRWWSGPGWSKIGMMKLDSYE